MASSAIVATVDSQSRVSIKTASGHSANLPSYQAHEQHIPAMEVVRSFSANTTGTWSSYSQILLSPDQLPDICDTFTLILNLGAATKTGGTYIGLVNDASWLQKLVEVRIGGQLISSIYPENWYLQPVLHFTNETKLKYLSTVGNASQATRRTNTAAGQVFYINIPIPFITKMGWLSKQHAAQLDIKIFHNDLSTIVDTDGTAPVLPINSVTLNVSGRNYLNQANLVAAVNSGRKLGHLDQRFVDPVQQQFTLTSGSSSYTVQLTNFNGLYSHLLFVVRAASSVGTPLGNAPDAFLPVVSYNYKDSAGNIILPEQTSAYTLGPYFTKYVQGDLTDLASGLGSVQKNVYAVFFDGKPYDAIRLGVQNGLMKLDGLSKLQITFASAIASNYVVDVIGYVWSNLVTDSAGGVTKTLVQ